MSNSNSSNSSTTSSSKRQPKEQSVGDALRAVYREAVNEDVPDSMLDLLNKLG